MACVPVKFTFCCWNGLCTSSEVAVLAYVVGTTGLLVANGLLFIALDVAGCCFNCIDWSFMSCFLC